MARVSRELYEQLGPLTYPDPENGWALACLLEGWCAVAALLEDGMRPEPGTGEPPWAKIVDPARCPWWALRWCGQLYGMRLAPMLGPWERPDAATEARWRQEITERRRWRRGTAPTLLAIARSHTRPDSDQRVQMRLRYNPALGAAVDAPWHIQVTIRASDLIAGQSDAATREHVEASPAGVVMHVVIADRPTWDDLVDERSTWTAVGTAYGTWNDVVIGGA
jgi:hypothetical protein